MQTKLIDTKEAKQNELDLLFSERKARYLLFRKMVEKYKEDVKKIDKRIDDVYIIKVK